MTEKPDVMTVNLKQRDTEATFSGTPEQVWLQLNKFFTEFLPTFEIADRLTLKTDLQKLVKACEGIVALAQDGVYVLAPKNKLTDNETLCLLLLAGYVQFRMGKTVSEAITKDELQTKLGKDAKITSTRLGELVKSEIAKKTSDDKYALTAFGVAQIEKEVLPRIRTKM